MKWIKWLLIGLCLILVIGVIFFPQFIVDKVKFPESIVYSSFFHQLREHIRPNGNEFRISEYNLPDSEHHEVKPLDKSQIEQMAKQLIPGNLESEAEKGKVILSSAHKKIMRDFRKPLIKELKELKEGWRLSRSTSNPNAVVTGDLFNLKPPKSPSNRNYPYSGYY